MPRKVISVTLICSLFIMFSALPVMALPVQTHSSAADVLRLTRPLMSADLKQYADATETTLEARAADGIESFLQYAGTLFLVISLIAIIGGTQMIVSGEDPGEGLLDVLLGTLFFIFALMMLGGSPDDGLPEGEPE